jgi:hypothetical protein
MRHGPVARGVTSHRMAIIVTVTGVTVGGPGDDADITMGTGKDTKA